MPLHSYIVYPRHGQGGEVAQRLGDIPGCEVVTSQKKDLLILVTETRNDEEEAVLQEKLEQVEELEWLAMTFGHA